MKIQTKYTMFKGNSNIDEKQYKNEKKNIFWSVLAVIA